MIRLGIIGAENSHSYAIGKTCNLDRVVPMRVPLIWGETRAFTKTAMERGGIPESVRDWREMLGRVDGVMIDHRHAALHVEPAEFFLRNGVPVFVDKPLAYRLRDAVRLVDTAAKRKVPITTFSSIPMQPGFQAFKKSLAKLGALRAVQSTGPVDLRSRWGGIFFYGIHQVDAMVELLGTAAHSVHVHARKGRAVATVLFESGAVVAMNCVPEEAGGFHWTACGDKGIATYPHTYSGNPYLVTARHIVRLVRNRDNGFSRERMLAPVAILEAMERSLRTGRPVRVPSF
jgi:predicted dehydrogenase